ncbi:DNA-binding helix-turn-helix protein [Leptospira terpstrae serovar Hualin str. LT 11-33 = ATCC 700639]|uniref:DNA-binding helix-turn-helix protein n=1 Tax=Leptospira terpstrae serovar Hualin str. LT 11-33 = ATCC 700639 TaxID=1257025 RepID=N1W496_9LEPT|nr:DNA-binding helix-turn-helix protein [Leptospira terpstrae serovar Hualin str. LT 11-33 = ATCC 700639]
MQYLSIHSTVTSATIVGLDTEIKKRVKGNIEWMSSRCFVFDGTLSHETALNGSVGILFADPGSEIGEVLTMEAGPNGLSSNPIWAQELIVTCFEIQKANPEQYPNILSHSFPFNRLTSAKKIQDDDRLIHVLRRLINSPEETVNVEELAHEIGMSESWLQHEFKNVVGLPIRAFRKWFRIKTAVIALKRGATLADAALNAGFYDQAHFTNVFRDIFGISPSIIFKKGESIRWYIQNEQIDTILKVL